MRVEIAALRDAAVESEGRAEEITHRTRYPRLVHSLGRRVLDAHDDRLDEVERELGEGDGAPGGPATPAERRGRRARARCYSSFAMRSQREETSAQSMLATKASMYFGRAVEKSRMYECSYTSSARIGVAFHTGNEFWASPM